MSFKKIDEQLTRDLRKSEALTWKSYQDRIPELRAFLADLYAKDGTLPMRKARLKDTQEQLSKISSSIYADILADVDRDLQAIYTGTFDASAKLLSTAVSMERKVEALAVAMKSPVGGVTLDLTLEAFETDLRNKLIREVVMGSAQGKTLPELLDNIETKFGQDAGRIKRLVNTDGHRLAEQAKMDSVGGASKTKTWVSMGDNAVRDSHQQLDGTTIPVDEPFRIGNDEAMFPGDFSLPENSINCRCWLEYNE